MKTRNPWQSNVYTSCIYLVQNCNEIYLFYLYENKTNQSEKKKKMNFVLNKKQTII